MPTLDLTRSVLLLHQVAFSNICLQDKVRRTALQSREIPWTKKAKQYFSSLLVSELKQGTSILGGSMLPVRAKAKAIKLFILVLWARARDCLINTWIHFQSNSDYQLCFSNPSISDTDYPILVLPRSTFCGDTNTWCLWHPVC